MKVATTVCALVSGLALAGPALAEPMLQFDLSCQGWVTDTANLERPEPFSTRLTVDLTTGRFCIDSCAAIFHLTKWDLTSFAYRYDVTVSDADHDAQHFRGPPTSTAGPFPMKDEISVDLATGAFRRLYQYEQGDRASVSHDAKFAGACTRAAFSGFAPGK